MSKIALITGASAGIGEACAEAFARGGYDLILTGRRNNRLEPLCQRLRTEHGITAIHLCFDIRDREAVATAWDSLSDKWQKVDVLVNNAGLAAGRDKIQNGSLDDWDQMIDTNVKGLLYMTKIVVQQMVRRRHGHIINIGSTAGREVYTAGNVYCATKFAVEALSRGMRMDLVEHNIKVSSVSPGLVETEFSVVRFKGDQDKADKVYQGIEPLVAKDIADMVWFVASQPPHICINDINLTCTQQASNTIVHREEK